MKIVIKKNIKSIIGIFVIVVLSFCMMFNNADNTKTLTTNGSVLSNEKIEWGIKRMDNHVQPDLGSKNKTLIEKYNGIAMGNKDLKKVYLTFDLGYEAGYTPKILEVLKQNDVKAVFFITAHYLNTQEELVKKMIEEGHIVGNHTVNHKSMPSLTNEQIKKEVMDLHTAVYNKFDYEMIYFRPPKGEFSEASIAFCNSLGYTSVMWSFAYDDWDENKQQREEYGKKKILDNIHNGAVILLHATSKDNSNILDYCIKQIKNMGYTFASLDEFEK